MKYLYYTLFISFSFLNLGAQNCLPDSTYQDSTAGVYPRPITPERPNGGIYKKACINKPYEFTFTVVVPDSILLPPLTTPIPLEKAVIDTVNAISNLPKGITYKCNPPDCIYKKNTFGCLILKGTPDNSNTPGDYKPIINLTVTINVGFPLDYSLKFPGAEIPGEYILTLLSENNCLTTTHNQNIASNIWYPNPSNGILNNSYTKIEHVKIYNSNGKLIYSENDQENKSIDLSLLHTEGMHFIHWIENNQAFIQKIIITK